MSEWSIQHLPRRENIFAIRIIVLENKMGPVPKKGKILHYYSMVKEHNIAKLTIFNIHQVKMMMSLKDPVSMKTRQFLYFLYV